MPTPDTSTIALPRATDTDTDTDTANVTVTGTDAASRTRHRHHPQHARRRPNRARPLHAMARPHRRVRALVLAAVVGLSPLAALSTFVLWAPTPAFATVVVQPGDTLSAIALRYHTTVAALVSANHIANANVVLAGSTLQVPVAATTSSATAVAPPATTVVVHLGDTLTSIALRYHTTVAALVSANHIANPNMVVAGTRLALPGPALPPGWGPGGPLPPTLLAHPDRLALRPDFLQASSASGIAPSVLEGLCWWESGWQSQASSSTGAIGLCQLEPSTVDYVRTTVLHDLNLDPHSAADNITMAAAYLHDLTVHDGGDLRTAVAAYYQGLTSVVKNGMMPFTQTYVTGVFNYAGLFLRAG